MKMRRLVSGSLLLLSIAHNESRALSSDPNLEILLSGYEEAYAAYVNGDDSAKDRAKYQFAAEITESIFDHVHDSRYLESLNEIEHRNMNAMAKADLAFRLQMTWEQSYLFRYYQMQQTALTKKRIPTQIFMDLFSLAVPGKLAEKVLKGGPRYFHLFRSAFVLSGGFVAAEAAQSDLSIPVPPASILSLGIPVSNQNMDLATEADIKAFYRSVVSNAIGASTSTAALLWTYRSLLWGKRAARVAGAANSLETLGTSLLVGLGVDVAATCAIDSIQESSEEFKIVDRIRAGVADFDRAIKGSDESAASASVTRLIRAAISFEAYHNAEVMREIAEQELELIHAKSSEQVERILEEHTAPISNAWIRPSRKSRGNVSDYFMNQLLLESGLSPLVEADNAPLEKLLGMYSPDLRSAGTSLIERFAPHSMSRIEAWNGTSAEKVEVFSQYLREEQETRIQTTATSFRRRLARRKVGKNPYQVLFETAMIIRSARSPFMDHFSEVLLDRVRKYTTLLDRLEHLP